MKLFKYFLTVLLFPLALIGQVIESGRFDSIIPFVGEKTLVLVDLDNTLFESELMLGSATWRGYFKKKAEDLSLPNPEELLEIYWDFLQKIVPVRLVDPQAPQIIDQLRKQDIVVLGFTARAKREVSHTFQQLHSLGVSFTPHSADLFDNEEKDAVFENGVVFCGAYKKAEAFALLLNSLRLCGCRYPSSVIFLDDWVHHVYALEEVARSYGIGYLGVRFSGADARVADFNSDVVESQWRHLPAFVPDAE